METRETAIREAGVHGNLLKLLHDIAVAVNESPSIERAIRYVLERVCTHNGWSAGHAYILSEEDGEELEPTGVWYIQRGADLEGFKRATMESRVGPGEGLIGRVYQTGKSIWVRDVSKQPTLPGRDVEVGELRGALIYPISLEGRVVAVAELYSKDEVRPSAEMMSVMQTVGTLLGQLFERNELECQVAELAAEEQRRVGRELHDVIGQQVTALGFLAKSLERRLKERSGEEAGTARQLAEGIEKTKGQIRALIQGLAPAGVRANDLMTSLEGLALKNERLHGLQCRVETDGRVRIKNDFVASQVYRIVQEALHNAVKHGSADRAVVVLRRHRDRAILKVSDNGGGFNTREPVAGSMGLKIMRHRAGLIDGELTVSTRPGVGTIVTCNFRQERA